MLSIDSIRRPGTVKKNRLTAPSLGRILKREKNGFANPGKAIFWIDVKEQQFPFTADHPNASKDAVNLPNQELRPT